MNVFWSVLRALQNHMMTLFNHHNNMVCPMPGCTILKEYLMQRKHLTMSNESFTEQSQTLTFLKVFASTLVLLVVSPLANLSLWKDPLKSLVSSQETKTNI